MIEHAVTLAACIALVCTNTPTPYYGREPRDMQTEDLELPSGEVVTVRGLTGMEVALISKRNGQLADDPDAPSGSAIQIGFVVLGKTKLRDAEAAGIAWLNEHAAGDFTAVSDRIEALSGYGKGAQKRAVDRATDD